MKVVILCGGRGTRFREKTEYKPKPMIEIGGRPILWHIMKIYAYYGFRDFVLCLGYKGRDVKEYFLRYELINSDFCIELGSKNITPYISTQEQGWLITLVDTGEDAMTGARLKRVEKYIDTDLFMLTYGDGLAHINISELVEFHKSHGKIGTVTGVHPSSRFGELVVDGNHVLEFGEKPRIRDSYINGGFFVFNNKIFSYVEDKDDCIFERKPLENLASDGELMIYKHEGFWQCMDTYRDLQLLDNLWKGQEIEKELYFESIKGKKPPWKVWED